MTMLRWTMPVWFAVLLLLRVLGEALPIPDLNDFFGVLLPLILLALMARFIRHNRSLLPGFFAGMALFIAGEFSDWLEKVLFPPAWERYLDPVDDFLISSGMFMLGLALVRLVEGRESLISQLHQEVSLRGSLQQQAEYLAYHDEMTALGNRRALFQALAEARAARLPGTLLYLDVNHFKQVNDRLGHDEGDKVLKAVARAISDGLHPGYRLGGDEFVLLLPAGSQAATDACIRHLHHAIKPLQETYGISLSIGQRRYQPQELADPDAILADADRSMYQEKQHYRSRMHPPAQNGDS